MKSTAINMSQMNLKALKELRHFQGSLIQNFLGEDIAGHPFFLPPSAVVCAPPPPFQIQILLRCPRFIHTYVTKESKLPHLQWFKYITMKNFKRSYFHIVVFPVILYKISKYCWLQ